MAGQPAEPDAGPASARFRPVLADPLARRLAPDRARERRPGRRHLDPVPVLRRKPPCRRPAAEGPLLLLFFLAAAALDPALERAAPAASARSATLLAGMALAILSFALGRSRLAPATCCAFALICVASGAALGADLTLLPAIFARRMAQMSRPARAPASACGPSSPSCRWPSPPSRLLPAARGARLRPGRPTIPPAALWLLTVLYALVPCVLKLVAIAASRRHPESRRPDG